MMHFVYFHAMISGLQSIVATVYGFGPEIASLTLAVVPCDDQNCRSRGPKSEAEANVPLHSEQNCVESHSSLTLVQPLYLPTQAVARGRESFNESSIPCCLAAHLVNLVGWLLCFCGRNMKELQGNGLTSHYFCTFCNIKARTCICLDSTACCSCRYRSTHWSLRQCGTVPTSAVVAARLSLLQTQANSIYS